MATDTTGKKFHNYDLDKFYYGLWSKRYGAFIDSLLKVKVEIPTSGKDEFKDTVPNGRDRVRFTNLDKEKANMYIFNENVLNEVLVPGAFHFPTKCVPETFYINEAKKTVTLKFSVPYGTKKESFAVTVKATEGESFLEDIGKRLCILKLVCRTNRQYHELVEMAAHPDTDKYYIKNLDRLIEVITGSSKNMVDDIPLEIQIPKKSKKED